MRYSSLLLAFALTLALAFLATPALAQQGGGGGGRGAFAPANPYEEMTKVVTTLTDEQKTKLKDKCDAMVKALTDLQTSQREKMQGLGQDATPEERQKVMTEIRTAREQLTAKQEAEVNSVLTPEQAAQWETAKLVRQTLARLGMVQPTDEQKTKINDLAKDFGKQIAELKDRKDVAAVTGKFMKKVLADVLTDEQAGRIFSQMGGGFGGGMGGPGGGGRGRGGAGGAAPQN